MRGVFLKIVVLSDSHGYPGRLRRVLSMHRDADLVCFLGDGLSDLSGLEAQYDVPICAVRGNCDGFGLFDAVPEQRVLVREGHRLLLAHGHRLGVKGGEGGLIAAARSEGCDIVLFGHTHLPCETYLTEYGMYLFNPGSIGHPWEGAPSYGLLMLSGRNVLFSCGTIDAGPAPSP